MDEFGPNLITLTDEEGVEYELEILAELEYNGETYLALTPAGAEEPEDMEVSILKSVEEDGEELLVAVEDETELENVYNAFIELSYEDEEA